MSTLTITGRTDAPAGRRVIRRAALLRAVAERARARIAHELAVRQAVCDLVRLDDRMLQDIGLRCTGIHYAAMAATCLTPANAPAVRRGGMERE